MAATEIKKADATAVKFAIPTGEIPTIIETLKGGRKLPDITKFNNEYDPQKHAIFTDQNKYQDRKVITDFVDVDNVEKKKTVTIPLNRIGLPYQKKIVSIATTFFCGNPIKYMNSDEESEIYKSFSAVIDRNKMKFIDREAIDCVGRFTEVAELWYYTEEDNEFYGFTSKYRLKVKILSPEIYELYPVFDDNDDLVAFSRGWKSTDGKKEFFETYTAEQTIKWEKEANWVQVSSVPNAIGKIPIVYRKQDKVEWADVQSIIDRVENIYSNTAESNDRFAFPILKLKGKVTGQLSNDKTGRVLQMEDGADADFVNSSNAGEALQSELDRLDGDIHDFTNTPNISFDNMKGLGNVLSGVGAEFLFLSAHLKVMDKLAIHVPAFQRRVSVIEAHLKNFNTAYAKEILDVEPVVTPFIINDDAEFIRFLMEANGGQPIYSQEYSMKLAEIKNPEEMIKQIAGQDAAVQENVFK